MHIRPFKTILICFSLLLVYVLTLESVRAHNYATTSDSKASPLSVDLQVDKPLVKDQLSTVKLKLTHKEDGKPLRLDEIKVTHTEKIHVLIFDESLTDYQHYHPISTKEPGVYKFEFTPKTNNQYKAWVDLALLKDNTHLQLEASFPKTEGVSQTPQKTLSEDHSIDTATGKINFKLSFENSEVKVGKHNHGTIVITDENGKPFKDLEPILGAFAHIVAINQDFSSLAHVHPMGKEPTQSSDRGGPELKFGFDPNKAGYWKIWVQMRINEKDINVPFGVDAK